jgi:hypothetical protein
MATTLMTHNADTGELVCFAAGDEVLRLTEPDFERAHAISNAIQKAYSKGSILGRLQMQQKLERVMDDINRA